jgi:serine/threonine-protein kinase
VSYEPRAAFAGQIAEVSVVELLQTILQGGHTGIARFETPVGAATLWFRDGALVDADMGRHHMEGAVQRLLALESGTFEVEFKPITRRQVINATTAEMIAQAPPRAGAPQAVPNDDNDVSRRRSRRAGISWHPTGGGKPRADASGSVPVMRPVVETSSAAVPIVAAPPTIPAPPTAAAAPQRSATMIAPAGAVPIIAANVTPLAPPLPAPVVVPTPTPAIPPHAVTPSVAPASRDAAPDPSNEVTTNPRRTVFGLPMATPPAPEADDDDRTLMRPSPSPPAPMFVPPPGPSAVPAAPPLQMESRPAQWGTATMPAVVDPPPSSAPRQVPVVVPTPTPGTAPPSGTAIESGRRPSASGEFEPADRTVLAPAPGWSPPSSAPVVVSAEVVASQTMTAGSIRRATPAVASRPGGARRTEERMAAVAGAIGMGAPPERRAVSDTARLDQQVEAAGAAGLTGASAPAVVGRYEVLLRIARGGMGTVYLARVTGEGGFRRLFALKVVRDHLSQNDEYVRMLLQEARIASRLHHPNVVGIVDIGTLANQHYLVMDYVEGCTFSELLKVHRRTRPPHLVVPILIDALMGLHAAHTLVDDDGSSLTLVHCDFSPQNMLVGTNGICRITDFGISKATNVINERPSITRGKPAYVSPEQVLGRPLDHRSDIFSAGVVLWNALTGEQLFSGDSPESTLQAVLQRPIPAPSTAGLRPPSCFDRVCMRALERDPAKRYQTAEQMLIDLRRVAIAEDFLAPSSDVGRWVSDTFGRQLELRRQAAGIAKGLGPDSQPMSLPVSVPELGLGDAELTSETRALPDHYGATANESNASKTSLLRSDVVPVLAEPGPADDTPPPAIGKALAVIAAVAIATIAISIAILRPEWIQGGSIDAYGNYSADDGDGGGSSGGEPTKPKDPKAKDTKADAKAPDAKATDAKAETPVDAKGLDAKGLDAKAIDGKAPVDPVTPPPVDPSKSVPPPPPDAKADKPKPKPKPKKPKPPKAPEDGDEPTPPDPSEVLDEIPD